MIQINIQWIGKCPKGHRYTPTSGPTFKSSCEFCQRLWRISKAEAELRRRMTAYEEALQSQNGGFQLR